MNDTALNYDSEEGIGKGIKRAIEEGIVKREDLFITTKGNDETTDTEEEIKSSLNIIYKKVNQNKKILNINYKIYSPNNDINYKDLTKKVNLEYFSQQ